MSGHRKFSQLIENFSEERQAEIAQKTAQLKEKMSPSISKVTKKYQATIPLAVRELLDLKCGDRISFEVENGQVILKKSISNDWDDSSSVSKTLNEWLSPEDEKAYNDL